MTKIQYFISAASAVVFLIIAAVRPARYTAETTFFVPLTFLEKQIQQNGMGFGSPVEVDAHIELMRSEAVWDALETTTGTPISMEVSRTRNGAVKVEVTSDRAELAAKMANESVKVTDSIKRTMLQQNVGQSFEFLALKSQKLTQEVNKLRRGLDSLRIEAQTDSLALAALVFQKERQFGAAVVELTQEQRKMTQIENYLQAPVPNSYILSKAKPPKSPDGLPAWAIALLAGVLTALSLYALNLLKKNPPSAA